jgi:hypothetical protein
MALKNDDVLPAGFMAARFFALGYLTLFQYMHKWHSI